MSEGVYCLIAIVVIAVAMYFYRIHLNEKKSNERNNLLERLFAEKEKPKCAVKIFLNHNGNYRQSEFFEPILSAWSERIVTSKERANWFVQDSFKNGYFDLSEQDRYVPIKGVVDVWIVDDQDDE